jgi:hypothetical protein
VCGESVRIEGRRVLQEPLTVVRESVDADEHGGGHAGVGQGVVQPGGVPAAVRDEDY